MDILKINAFLEEQLGRAQKLEELARTREDQAEFQARLLECLENETCLTPGEMEWLDTFLEEKMASGTTEQNEELARAVEYEKAEQFEMAVEKEAGYLSQERALHQMVRRSGVRIPADCSQRTIISCLAKFCTRALLSPFVQAHGIAMDQRRRALFRLLAQEPAIWKAIVTLLVEAEREQDWLLPALGLEMALLHEVRDEPEQTVHFLHLIPELIASQDTGSRVLFNLLEDAREERARRSEARKEQLARVFQPMLEDEEIIPEEEPELQKLAPEQLLTMAEEDLPESFDPAKRSFRMANRICDLFEETETGDWHPAAQKEFCRMRQSFYNQLQHPNQFRGVIVLFLLEALVERWEDYDIVPQELLCRGISSDEEARALYTAWDKGSRLIPYYLYGLLVLSGCNIAGLSIQQMNALSPLEGFMELVRQGDLGFIIDSEAKEGAAGGIFSSSLEADWYLRLSCMLFYRKPQVHEPDTDLISRVVRLYNQTRFSEKTLTTMENWQPRWSYTTAENQFANMLASLLLESADSAAAASLREIFCSLLGIRPGSYLKKRSQILTALNWLQPAGLEEGDEMFVWQPSDLDEVQAQLFLTRTSVLLFFLDLLHQPGTLATVSPLVFAPAPESLLYDLDDQTDTITDQEKRERVEEWWLDENAIQADAFEAFLQTGFRPASVSDWQYLQTLLESPECAERAGQFLVEYDRTFARDPEQLHSLLMLFMLAGTDLLKRQEISASLLPVFEGRTDRLLYEQENSRLKNRIAQLEQENKALRTQMRESGQKKYQEGLRAGKEKAMSAAEDSRQELKRLKKAVAEHHKEEAALEELAQMRSFLYTNGLMDAFLEKEKTEAAEEERLAPLQEAEEKELADFIREHRVVLIGGHYDLLHELKERYPQLDCCAGVSFDLRLIDAAEYAIYFTKFMKHTTYHKVRSQCERQKRRYERGQIASVCQEAYIGVKNLELCRRELHTILVRGQPSTAMQ